MLGRHFSSVNKGGMFELPHGQIAGVVHLRWLRYGESTEVGQEASYVNIWEDQTACDAPYALPKCCRYAIAADNDAKWLIK